MPSVWLAEFPCENEYTKIIRLLLSYPIWHLSIFLHISTESHVDLVALTLWFAQELK